MLVLWFITFSHWWIDIRGENVFLFNFCHAMLLLEEEKMDEGMGIAAHFSCLVFVWFFFSSSLRDAGGWIYFLWGFLISFLTLKLLNCFCYYAFFRAVAAAYTNLFSYSPFIFRFKKNSIILNSTRLSNFLMIRKEHFKETIFFW